MIVTELRPVTTTAHDGAADRSAEPTALLLRLGFGVLGAFYVAAGVALRGSSWILPDGLLAGGVALLVLLPWIRGALDALLVIVPFMFYTLSPLGGILTVGTSDSFLPFVAGVVLVSGATGSLRSASRLKGAGWFLVPGGVLMLGNSVWWNILSPSFLVERALEDMVKVGIGIVYLIVVYHLAMRAGLDRTLRSVWLWVCTASGLSVCVVVGAAVGVELVPTDGFRSLGYFEDANLFAGYLLVSLSLVLFLAFASPSGWLALHASTLLCALVATGSRGGLVSLALLGLFTVLVVNSWRLRVFVVIAVGAGSVMVWWLVGRSESGTTILGLDRLFFASRDVNDDPRMDLWVRAVEKWLDAPLWGIGMGQFERFSGDVFAVARSTGLGYVTHNTFLYFLASLGVVGGLLFVGFIVWMVRYLYRSRGMDMRARHGLAAGLLMVCSQMMTLNLQNLRYVWVYFGLVLALSALSAPGAEEEGSDVAPSSAG